VSGGVAAPRKVVRPLSAVTYLVRNPRRVLPVVGIQALVTCLLVAIITPTNAFEATSDAYVRPLRTFTIVTPWGLRDFDDELRGILDANPAQERNVPSKMFWMRTPMIVGEAYAPLVAIDVDLQQAFLERVEGRLVEGRLPERGTAGAAVHRAVLRARGLRIGDKFGQQLDPEDSTPGVFEVVGALDGPARVGIADLQRASDPKSVYARQEPFQVVYAKPGRKPESDRYLHAARTADDNPALRVFDEEFVRSRLAKTLRNLPLILGFITASVAIVVALVTALLNVIAFQVRVDEFGLFLAVGHSRRRLVAKLATESVLMALAGWVLGLAAGIGVVALYRGLALEPKGILMRLVDARPLWYSTAVPVLSCALSAIALTRRLRRMDPVTVIQRRGT
jgi:putative ABC transport system permease protein